MGDEARRRAALRLQEMAKRAILDAANAPNQHEGWKGSGRCKICRRRRYCSKLCRAARVRVHAIGCGTLAAILINQAADGQ